MAIVSGRENGKVGRPQSATAPKCRNSLVGKIGVGKIGVTSKHFTFVIQKSANFPRHIAREIVEDLEAALQQFAAIAQDLKK
jgi:hypothetical protein